MTHQEAFALREKADNDFMDFVQETTEKFGKKVMLCYGLSPNLVPRQSMTITKMITRKVQPQNHGKECIDQYFSASMFVPGIVARQFFGICENEEIYIKAMKTLRYIDNNEAWDDVITNPQIQAFCTGLDHRQHFGTFLYEENNEIRQHYQCGFKAPGLLKARKESEYWTRLLANITKHEIRLNFRIDGLSIGIDPFLLVENHVHTPFCQMGIPRINTKYDDTPDSTADKILAAIMTNIQKTEMKPDVIQDTPHM